MADLNEVRALLALDPKELEERLAIEFGVTEGIRVTASLSKAERGKRITRAKRRLRTRIKAAVRKSGKVLHKIACKDLKYCERRETATEVVIVGLIDAYIIELTLIPVPMAGLCVYTVKTGLLDEVCDCHEAKRNVFRTGS